MTSNFLDLRHQEQPQVVVVEKTIIKSRSRLAELARFLVLVTIVTASVWGITKASEELAPVSLNQDQVVVKNFSTIGLISNIDAGTVSITSAKGSATFNTDTVSKVETKSYVPLGLGDLKVGDRIILQGLESDGIISIRRVITFSPTTHNEALGPIATTTTAVKPIVKVEATTDTPVSTEPSFIEKFTNSISDTVTDVIEIITGTDTSTTTEQTSATTTATTTEPVTATTTATTTEPIATTTPLVTSTTTEPVATTTPSVIDQVVEAVTETVNQVIETVTGSGEETPPSEEV